MRKLLMILSVSCLMIIGAAPALAQIESESPSATGTTPDETPELLPPSEPPQIECDTYPCEPGPKEPTGPTEPTKPPYPEPPYPEPPYPESPDPHCPSGESRDESGSCPKPPDPPCPNGEPRDEDGECPEPPDPEPTDPESPEPTEPTDQESTSPSRPVPPSGDSGGFDSGGDSDYGDSDGFDDGSDSVGDDSGPGDSSGESYFLAPGSDLQDGQSADARDPQLAEGVSGIESVTDPKTGEVQPEERAAAPGHPTKGVEEVLGVLENTALLSSEEGGIGVLLALVGLSAAGLAVSQRAQLKPTIPDKPGIGGSSASNEAIERATGASAEAVESFSSARTAAKATGAPGGSGEGYDTAGESAPEAQTTDVSSDPVLAAWAPGKLIRLLIADDELAARINLREMLESQSDFKVVGEASTGVEAVELAERLHPRVVLTDLHLTGMDGVATSARIRTSHSDTYTLVTADEEGDADIVRAIEAGASGCLLKDAPREEVFETIRATAQGETTNDDQQ